MIAHRDRQRRGVRVWASIALLWLIALALSMSLLPASRPPTRPAGRLAYIGADGNVYIAAPDLGTSFQVTHDATVPAEGDGLSYHRIAWSPDGSLAFAAVERSGATARGRLYAVRTLTDTPHLIAEAPSHFVIYTYWSPAPCLNPGACPGGLVYLISEDDAVALHHVTWQNNAVADRTLANGRPFYLSWSPGGEQIVWHTGDELALLTLGGERAQPIPAPSPAFSAPAWSPSGDRWLAVVRDSGADVLTSFSGSGPTPLFPFDAAEIAFSWSPDTSPGGSTVAYAIREQPTDPFYSPVHLLDPDSGETRRLTPTAFRPLAFFWSPDGRRLAYLSWLDLPQETWAQWRTIDVATGEDRGFAAFRPSPLMHFALHSFTQYAQSHRFWSPDGRYLVYAARNDAGTDGIWLVDTFSPRGTDPTFLAPGSLAYWSFQ
jgi:WD40 repeat protein